MISIAAVIVSSIDAAAAEEQLLKTDRRSQRTTLIQHRSKSPYEQCPCPRILWQVCGSDGITYGNKCLFNCAAKRRSGLKMVKAAPCDSEESEEEQEPKIETFLL